MSIDVNALALLYSKPVEFVEACISVHGIKVLPRYRTADDGLSDFYSDLTSHYDTSPSMTKQEFTAECDLNTIMKRFIASDFDPSVVPITSRQPRYGDFSNMPSSYHEALNYVRDTELMFLQLPAHLRSRFDNDAQNFLNFLDDPANEAEIYELGFAVRKDVPAPSASNSAGDGGGASAPLDRGSKRSTVKKTASTDADDAGD